MRWFGVLFDGGRMSLGYWVCLAVFMMHAVNLIQAMALAVKAVCSRVCLPPALRSEAISFFLGIGCAFSTTAKFA